MLNYTTVSAMLVVLPNVSSSTNATSAQLAFIAEGEEAVMDTVLRQQYSLPFTYVDPVLKRIARELAVYSFLTRRVFSQEKQNNSEWPDRYRESWDLLNRIATGELPLSDGAGGVIPVSVTDNQIWSNTMGFRPTMTEDDPEGQFVDPEKLKQIRMEREQFVDVLDAGPVP
jgi:phage gp36-like protein